MRDGPRSTYTMEEYLDDILDRVCGRNFSAVIEHQFHVSMGVGLYSALMEDPLAAEGVLAMILGSRGAVESLFAGVARELGVKSPSGGAEGVSAMLRLAMRRESPRLDI